MYRRTHGGIAIEERLCEFCCMHGRAGRFLCRYLTYLRAVHARTCAQDYRSYWRLQTLAPSSASCFRENCGTAWEMISFAFVDDAPVGRGGSIRGISCAIVDFGGCADCIFWMIDWRVASILTLSQTLLTPARLLLYSTLDGFLSWVLCWCWGSKWSGGGSWNCAFGSVTERWVQWGSRSGTRRILNDRKVWRKICLTLSDRRMAESSVAFGCAWSTKTEL